MKKRIIMHRLYFRILLLLSITCLFESNVHASITVSDFFNDLYNRHSSVYASKREPVFIDFCREFGLNEGSQENKNLFYKLYFLHDLFTGIECRDFIAGGVLQIPYAWHWINPNPRHTITYRPEGIPLVKVKPPSKFSRYKSFADIDRVPSLYIKDLFSISPKYYHPAIGNFYGFGWCSEREMAYASLVSVLGYNCKIKQEGIHVQTEICAQFVHKKNITVSIIIKVDNSMDILEWQALGQTLSLENWQSDLGNGSQIQWYNKVAFSKKEQQWIATTKVEKEQYQWIEAKLKLWLEFFV